MVLLKLLIFTLTFYKLIVHLDATCPKGQRITKDKGCEDCNRGYFQPDENDSKKCKVCRNCDPKTMIIERECTTVADAVCKCHEGFFPWTNDQSSCFCPKGYGLKEGETHTCSKCETGYFSPKKNSPCQKWRECKSLKVKGSNTTDAICDEEKSNVDITTAPTSNKLTSFIKHLQTMRPHEGAQTQEMNATTTPTTTAFLRHTVTSRTKVTPIHPSNTGIQMGMMTLLIFGIVGLLVLTAVTCRLHITPCVQKKPAVQVNDPLCRRPVEESGDDSLCPLKLNPGKP